MIRSGPVRVLLGAALATVVGFLFYNPVVNPIGTKIFIDAYYGGDMSKHVDKFDMRIPLAATILGLLVLAACINQYVNYRQIATRRLFRMAFELWVMMVCLQGPHVLWASLSVKAFLFDLIYDFLVIAVISFVVGYKRFDDVDKRYKFSKFN